MSNIVEELKNIISLKLGVPKESIEQNSHLSDDLNADPLSVADIITSIEEKFGVNLPREELIHINTISDLTEAISERLST